MTPDKVDRLLAAHNPWGLTAHQCYALRMICKHGGTKRAAYAENINARNTEHHLRFARKAMGLLGTDVRVYLMFDRWVQKFYREMS